MTGLDGPITTSALPDAPPDPEPLRDGEEWTGFDERAPRRQPRGEALGPCGRCRAGDHTCTGVGCYGCRHPDHRTHGLFAGSNGLAGGSSPSRGRTR